MSTLDTAIVLATVAHEGQKRKITNEPYILHPMRVMLKAIHFGMDFGIVAILHDTLEDTSLTIPKLKQANFSGAIIDSICRLTKTLELPYNEYLDRLKSDPIARVVKVLDIEDNLYDLETVGTFAPEDEVRLRLKYETALATLRGR